MFEKFKFMARCALKEITFICTMLNCAYLSLQVQLAKLAGCHVIGTCSTDAKAEFLKVGLPVVF